MNTVIEGLIIMFHLLTAFLLVRIRMVKMSLWSLLNLGTGGDADEILDQICTERFKLCIHNRKLTKLI